MGSDETLVLPELPVEETGVGIPLSQARAFTRFLHRWLRGKSDRALPDFPDDAFELLPDGHVSDGTHALVVGGKCA